MSDSTTFGRYTTSRVLGRGAMGVVYAAVDPVIGRNVALKMIRDDYGTNESAEITSRFEREFQTAGKLSHPNIVPIYDVGREGDAWYIAMELVEGVSLEDVMVEGAQPVEKSLNTIAGIAPALDHSHDLGVVHRDIKPANILVTTAGIPKVTDFGVAKLSGNTMTAAGSILGTPAYMSPEQARGEVLIGASDQFSLAVIAYQMLTGTKPFDGDSPTTVMFKIVSDDPPSPSSVNAKLPAALDAVLLRGLNKSPEQRFSGCVQFADALRSAWGMDTDATVAVGAPMAAGKKRKPALPVMVAGASVAAVLAIIGWIVMGGQADLPDDSGGLAADNGASTPGAASTPPATSQPRSDPPPTVPEEPVEAVDGNADSGTPAPIGVDEASGAAEDEPNEGDVSAGDPEGAVDPAGAIDPGADPEPPAVVAGEPFTVTSQPPGAAVTLDGTEVGTTTIRLRDAAGHPLRVAADA